MSIPWNNLHSPYVVLETSTDPDAAKRKLHDYAHRITRLHQEKRYGVFVRRRKGVYQVVLKDRGAERRAKGEREHSTGPREGGPFHDAENGASGNLSGRAGALHRPLSQVG